MTVVRRFKDCPRPVVTGDRELVFTGRKLLCDWGYKQNEKWLRLAWDEPVFIQSGRSLKEKYITENNEWV
jgi:hypothetical protein